jgi:membrane-associated phospholipid phosphatase
MRETNLKLVAWCFPISVFAVLVSWRFLDARIALAIMQLINSSVLLQTGISDIPDLLFLLVCAGSGFLWSRYLLLKHRGIVNDQARFCQLAGSSLLLAYFLKWLFKIVFGRINTRAWLAHPVSDNFHWFHGGGDYSGFPSGHMAVFTAFFAAVWLMYPRYRSIAVGLTLVLAVALIATDYHFLSDVIAGAYLGLLTTTLTSSCLDIIRNQQEGCP